MKLVLAFVGPEKLSAVEAVLSQWSTSMSSVSRASIERPDRRGMYRGVEFSVREPKLRVEIAVEDADSQAVADDVTRACFADDSESRGGRVFILPLDECRPAPLNRPARLAEGQLLLSRHAASLGLSH